MKQVAATMGALSVLMAAGAAEACMPALPQTPSERAEALWERQDRAFDQARTIVEYEVLRAWDVHPPEAQPPYDGDTHVELRPVRMLRGDVAQGPVEFVHQRHCGYAMTYPTDPGTRVLVYSTRDRIAALEDVFELVPRADVTHGATVEALGGD